MRKDYNLLLLKNTLNTLKRALVYTSNDEYCYDPWVDHLFNIIGEIELVLSKNSFCNENEANGDDDFKSRILNQLNQSKTFLEQVDLINYSAAIRIKKVTNKIKGYLNCIEVIIELYESNYL